MREILVGVVLGLLTGPFLAVPDGAAQLYRFGKNKVQFAEFQWQKMKTPHFEVYFYAEEEELAALAANLAEEGFRDLEAKFAYTVQRRVPLIVYSSHIYFEQTNIIPNLLPEGVGGFTEFLKGRVALPLTGSLPEFERVLHHELVHVFMFERIHRVLERRGVTQFHPAPLWFSEGLAEYWSGPWDSYGDMVMRDALFSNRLVSIARMHTIYGSFQLYKEGQSICEYMAATYGDDVFQLLLENWWRADNFAEVFRITTGSSLEELDADWQYHLHKRYYPDIEASDPPGQVAEALTETGFNLKPEIIPAETDSAEFVFFTNSHGYTQIARGSVHGGQPAVVMEGERAATFESLHPLSTKLAVSADGRWLAFAAQRRGRDYLHVWDLQEDREHRALSFGDVVAISSPSWSPTGREVAFSGADPGGTVDLYLADAESGELRRVTSDLYHDRDPDWSPDGRRIVFSSDRWAGGREGYYNLFVLDVQSGRIRPLTRGRHNDLHPSWSPDGAHIAYSSDRDTMYNLYRARLTEGPEGSLRVGSERLTHVLTGAFDPVWLPDQTGLLFSGYQGRRFQIYRLDLETGPDPDLSVPADLDSLSPAGDRAWALEGLKNRSLFAKRAYERKLSLDIAQSQISQDPEFGTSGGIQVGLSDVLGNDHYYFILSHIAGSETGFFDGLNVALTRLHLGRQLDVAWGAFRLNDRFTSRFGRFVREKRTGAYVELSYPFSMFSRLETRLSARRSDVDREVEGQGIRGWLMGNQISYTRDTSMWIPTGPLEGMRYSLGLGQTVDFRSSRRYNTTVFGDFRYYQRFSRRTGWALRLMGRRSVGDVPEYFSLGGSWTLRGYPWRSIWGSKMLLLNNELRFPLLDRLVISFPFGTVGMSALRGALFADAGNAWNDEFGDWKGSLGYGIRLGLGGVFVFRMDWSRRTDFKSVENETRWEFFFGWDY